MYDDGTVSIVDLPAPLVNYDFDQSTPKCQHVIYTHVIPASPHPDSHPLNVSVLLHHGLGLYLAKASEWIKLQAAKRAEGHDAEIVPESIACTMSVEWLTKITT